MHLGELAERFKAPSWKGGDVKASVSSNLMLSAITKRTELVFTDTMFGFIVSMESLEEAFERYCTRTR